MKRLLLTGLSMLTLLTVATPAALAEVREVASPRIENPFDLQRINPYDHPPAPTTIRDRLSANTQPQGLYTSATLDYNPLHPQPQNSGVQLPTPVMQSNWQPYTAEATLSPQSQAISSQLTSNQTSPVYDPFDLQRLNPWDHPPAPNARR